MTTPVRALTDPSLAVDGEVFVYARLLPDPSFRPAYMTVDGPAILGDFPTKEQIAELLDGLPELAEIIHGSLEDAFDAMVQPEWLWRISASVGTAIDMHVPSAEPQGLLDVLAATPAQRAASAAFMDAIKLAVLWQGPSDLGAAWAEREAVAAHPFPTGSWQSTWIEAQPLVPDLVPEDDIPDFATAINEAARKRWEELVEDAGVAR